MQDELHTAAPTSSQRPSSHMEEVLFGMVAKSLPCCRHYIVVLALIIPPASTGDNCGNIHGRPAYPLIPRLAVRRPSQTLSS